MSGRRAAGMLAAMAHHLYRLGDWAFTRRRTAVALWLVVLVAVIGAAVAVGGKTNDKFTVPGTESQQAQELLEQKFPEASGTYWRRWKIVAS